MFLLAFFFYIDGVYTIIDMATAYGSALGLDSTGLLLALLVTQIVAFPCAIIFGNLSYRIRTEKLIIVCIVAYLGIAIFAVFLKTQLQFWILAILVGMFQGGIQALSRSYFTKIIPEEHSGEYFGLMDICGKGCFFFSVSCFIRSRALFHRTAGHTVPPAQPYSPENPAGAVCHSSSRLPRIPSGSAFLTYRQTVLPSDTMSRKLP